MNSVNSVDHEDTNLRSPQKDSTELSVAITGVAVVPRGVCVNSRDDDNRKVPYEEHAPVQDPLARYSRWRTSVPAD